MGRRDDMEPRETDIGRIVRNVARARLILAAVLCAAVVGLCAAAAVALTATLLWNAAHGH